MGTGWAPSRAALSCGARAVPLWSFPTNVETGFEAPGVSLGVTGAAVAAAGGGDEPQIDWFSHGYSSLSRPLDLTISIPASVGFAVSSGILGAFAGVKTPVLGGGDFSDSGKTPPQPLRSAPLVSARAGPFESMLQLGFLWDRVRVQGGAYGAGMSINSGTALLGAYSYRDPTPAKSLKAFRDAPGALIGSTVDGEAFSASLDKAVITEIGGRDAPEAPVARGGRAASRWLHGGSHLAAQARRDELLSTKVADAHVFAEALKEGIKGASDAVVGGDKALADWKQTKNRGRIALKPLL